MVIYVFIIKLRVVRVTGVTLAQVVIIQGLYICRPMEIFVFMILQMSTNGVLYKTYPVTMMVHIH